MGGTNNHQRRKLWTGVRRQGSNPARPLIPRVIFSTGSALLGLSSLLWGTEPSDEGSFSEPTMPAGCEPRITAQHTASVSVAGPPSVDGSYFWATSAHRVVHPVAHSNLDLDVGKDHVPGMDPHLQVHARDLG